MTGAAGYIGSHAALALLDAGHRVLGIDHFGRGHRGAIDVLARAGGSRFTFLEADLLNGAAVEAALRGAGTDTVMHFAALAYVGESVVEPLRYWWNNAGGTISLLRAMVSAGVRRIVLSSTCATYGVPHADRIPIDERCPQQPINPYGRSKLAAETALLDLLASPEGASFEAVILRYFNVAGADPRGRLGEDHRPETHLVPIAIEAAMGRRAHVDLFGEDYPTPDGTCVRDYVHVSDLASAHLHAMELRRPGAPLVANVGIGRGFSVRQVLDACRRVCGSEIAVRSAPRRPGDPPTLVANASLIRRELGWTPRFDSLDAIVETAWAWRRAHPDGYGPSTAS